jgi:hypothetical protein
MSNRKILALFVAAALALPAVSMSTDEPVTRSTSSQAKATVVAVNQATRMVTLKGEDGKNFDVEAGKHVEHLDKLKPGDVVSATFTESFAYQVIGKDEKPSGVSDSVNKDVGTGELGRTVTSSFKIASYDPNTHILWVTTDKGETKKITVEDPKAQAKLSTLSPGNAVKVTYSQSLAIKLEKDAK